MNAKVEIMEQTIERTIGKIMGKMQCPKNFKCVESEFEVLCRVDDFGLENYVECLDQDAWDCKFGVSFSSGCLCGCPLRVYISKKLQK